MKPPRRVYIRPGAGPGLEEALDEVPPLGRYLADGLDPVAEQGPVPGGTVSAREPATDADDGHRLCRGHCLAGGATPAGDTVTPAPVT